MDRLERDFYAVELDKNGKKRIHVFGFCWSIDDFADPFRNYRNEEFTFCYLNPGFTEEEYDEAVSNCKHYIEECTEDEIVAIMDKYFAKNGGYAEFPMRRVTHDTPCGFYLDY